MMSVCWWCCHSIEGAPLQMPYSYDNLRDSFATAGYFCSWSCVKAYAIDNHGTGEISGNIGLLRKKMFGTKISETIKKAPRRQQLQMFGGDMTIEEFRENCTKNDIVQNRNEVKTSEIPTRVVPIISNNKKLDEIKNASGSNDTLRLKRQKPLKREENNLVSTLGLKVTVKP